MNDINVHIMDTVREDDGLAMSSRNAYLDADQRRASPVIYKALCAARELYDSRFSRGMEFIDATVLPMQPLAKIGSDGCIVSLACMLGTVRLRQHRAQIIISLLCVSNNIDRTSN